MGEMMLFRLFLFVVWYVALGGIAVYGTYRAGKRYLQPYIEKRKRQLKGMRNALLLAQHQEEACFICLKPTDPERDPYDARRGWHHSTCWEKLLND